MKRIIAHLSLLFFISLLTGAVSGQVLLNELAVDPPGADEPCEYFELKGTPGAPLNNIYFVAIEGNSEANPGVAATVIGFSGGIPLGSNGLLVFVGTQQCGSRTYPSATTVIANDFFNTPRLRNGSQTFLLISSTTAITPNVDYDADNNGTLEGLPAGSSILDSIGWSDGGASDRVYGPALTADGGTIGAATRFLDNTTANSAGAWFGGALAGSSNSSVSYSSSVRTANFPSPPFLGVLTPGMPNNLIIVDNFPARPFDFDGDAKTDISVFRSGSSAEWWRINSGTGTAVGVGFGTTGDQPVPADYTGDGKTDIAFFRPGNSTWYVLRSNDNTFYAFPFGASTDVLAPADFDGDFKADAAVYRAGTWYILKSSNGQVEISAFGVAGDKPIPADFDGDGRADRAIFRPNGASGAEFWLSRSVAGLYAAAFGSSTDRAVVGDWTGDGKADIAFFRPGVTAQWFVLRSEDSSFFAFPFGSSGDAPAPGDYDGDGRMDAAVFRTTGTPTWYINRSTQGATAVAFGIASDAAIPGVFVR